MTPCRVILLASLLLAPPLSGDQRTPPPSAGADVGSLRVTKTEGNAVVAEWTSPYKEGSDLSRRFMSDVWQFVKAHPTLEKLQILVTVTSLDENGKTRTGRCRPSELEDFFIFRNSPSVEELLTSLPGATYAAAIEMCTKQAMASAQRTAPTKK